MYRKSALLMQIRLELTEDGDDFIVHSLALWFILLHNL
jgi:hypothetical protein